MGFRFFRRIRLAPGVTVNFSRSGPSLSLGPRGAKVTLGPRGAHGTVGIPGTGIFYTTKFGGGARDASGRAPLPGAPAPPPAPRGDPLDMGFFKRLMTPDDEEALVDGCRDLTLGRNAEALSHLREATTIADGAFLAGVTALRLGNAEEAAGHLRLALERPDDLGVRLARHGIRAGVDLEITDELTAHVEPGARGALLALAEAEQAAGRGAEAIATLKDLRRLEPDDPVVMLSLCELLCAADPPERQGLQAVATMTEGVPNDSHVHAALLLYRARALRILGLLDPARMALSLALRRRKDRPPELVLALRRESAILYAAMGEREKAREELAAIEAEHPGFEDVPDLLKRL